jgi:hypothetical protein
MCLSVRRVRAFFLHHQLGKREYLMTYELKRTNYLAFHLNTDCTLLSFARTETIERTNLLLLFHSSRLSVIAGKENALHLQRRFLIILLM